MKKILTVFVAAFLLVGCDDLFTPAIENNKQVSDGLEDPCMQKEFWLMLILVIPTIHSHLMMWLQMTL